METVHRSKIDAWLIAVMAISIAGSLFVVFKVASTRSPMALPFAAFFAVISVGPLIWLLSSTRYTLGGGQLLVRSGPFKWSITVAEITSITPTSNPLSSPALSLNRLRIEYGHGQALMISPRDKEQFIRDIEAARR